MKTTIITLTRPSPVEAYVHKEQKILCSHVVRNVLGETPTQIDLHLYLRPFKGSNKAVISDYRAYITRTVCKKLYASNFRLFEGNSELLTSLERSYIFPALRWLVHEKFPNAKDLDNMTLYFQIKHHNPVKQ